MNVFKLLWVFLLLFGFALTLGYTLGILFSVETGNIAVIEIYGYISSFTSSPLEATANAEDIIEAIKLADANPLIEGLILDISSPGGSAVPSALIMDAVLNFSKPNIAFIRDAGASGAYLIASAADSIVAHEFSLIGAIGAAISPYLEYSGLIDDYNVTYVNLSYPEHKDMGSPYREMTDLEFNWSLTKLMMLYESILASIASNRGLSVEELRPIANGSYYLGSEGLEYGLIDYVGSFNDAKDLLVEAAGIKYPELITYRRQSSYLDILSYLKTEQNPLEMIENVVART